jgi:hypothetical protein
MKRWALLSLAVTSALTLGARPASAWDVRTPTTEPCHERITLGALGVASGVWQSLPAEPGRALLARLVELAERSGGVPTDAPTRQWHDEMSRRFGLGGHTAIERHVLASFLAGVREPDLGGRHASQLGQIRGLHFGDDNQPQHTLRRRDDPAGSMGDRAALTAARAFIEDRMSGALEGTQAPVLRTVRVTLAHYGEVPVRVLGVAFELGLAAHALQDAYTHTLRDEDLRIVAVLNWVNAVERSYDEHRHGPAHSDRLDQCRITEHPLDALRYRTSQRTTRELVAASVEAEGEEQGETRVGALLDEVFAYRAGCRPDNDYCDSPWLPLAESAPTRPFSWLRCSAALPSAGDWGGAGSVLVCLVLLGGLRRRARLDAI